MAKKKRKILVHTCCAPCASYVFSELEKSDFEVISLFYNPQIHGRAEYKRRLDSLKYLCEEKNIKLLIPEYDMQEFLSMLSPYQDERSIKYISDQKRYVKKRCQLCISLLIDSLVHYTKKYHYKYMSTTMLCSPFRDHNEIWDRSLESATKNKINFVYKDFRKGYWTGRNNARFHKLHIPAYCGCGESLEEGLLE